MFEFTPRFIVLLLIVAFVFLVVFKGGRSGELRRTCRACGSVHPPFARFCRKCGKRL